MPYAEEYVRVEQLEGEPCRLASAMELEGREGFVLAPFIASDDCPLLLIRPDRVTMHNVAPLNPPSRGKEDEPTVNVQPTVSVAKRGKKCSMFNVQCSIEGRTAYHHCFEKFHRELQEGRFSKIVLARQSKDEFEDDIDAEQLFLRACRAYPRMFVALVSTQESGTWLMATPEVLLETTAQHQLHTMALAGTMVLRGRHLTFDTPLQTADGGIRWSDKNIEEQRLVATYIYERLESLALDIEEQGPRTVRAGNLAHLRSDFRFTLREGKGVGAVLEALYPTPAVCGIPKRETMDFICQNESAPRRYYSGYCGPLNLAVEGLEERSTSLFVSLRCMQMNGRTCLLHAGGGLLKESAEQSEWDETEAKMQTMRNLFDNEL